MNRGGRGRPPLSREKGGSGRRERCREVSAAPGRGADGRSPPRAGKENTQPGLPPEAPASRKPGCVARKRAPRGVHSSIPGLRRRCREKVSERQVRVTRESLRPLRGGRR